MLKQNPFAGIFQDVRYGLRGLLKNPALVVIASLSLGLGIGLNATAYSLVRAVLLRNVTAIEPERLRRVEFGNGNTVSYQNYRELGDSAAQSNLFSTLVAHTNNLHSSLNWRSGNETTSIVCQSVSSNFFDALGIKAAIGRTFTAEEAAPDKNTNLVVISDAFWRTSLGTDSKILGSVLTLNGQPYTVVGVLPPNYWPIGGPGFNPKLYIPISRQILPGIDDRSTPLFEVVGRLAPGVTADQAQAGISSIAQRLEEAYPEQNKDLGKLLRLFPVSGLEWLKQANKEAVGVPLLELFGVLLGVVGLVLMVACGNVANLLLARGISRRREIAVRLALGASRQRLIRQLLVESLLLSFLATTIGLLISMWLSEVLNKVHFSLPLPIEFRLAPDWLLLIYGLLIAFGTSLLCGLAPALQVTQISLVPALKNEPAQFANRRFTLRNILVVAQVAISMVLLVGASLFLRNLMHISQIDPGFNVNNTLSAYVSLIPGRYSPEQRAVFLDKALNELSAIPSVESVSCANFPPLTLNDWGTNVRLESGGEADRFRVNFQFVGPNYFSTMGIKLLGGREFQQSDRKDSPKVVVINETLAKRYFPGQDPIGKRLFGAVKPIEIVGLASDSKYRTLGEESRLLMYYPYQQGGDFWGGDNVCLLVRSVNPPDAIISTVRNRLADLDPSASVEANTTRDNMIPIFYPSQMGAILLGGLAALGLVLAMIGLYGVIAYTINQRTPELGIRMALGASRARILQMLVKEGLTLILAGIALGTVLSLQATRALSMLLAAGVSNTDVLSFMGSILVLVLVGLVSNLIAARKALRLNPLVALRYS